MPYRQPSSQCSPCLRGEHPRRSRAVQHVVVVTRSTLVHSRVAAVEQRRRLTPGDETGERASLELGGHPQATNPWKLQGLWLQLHSRLRRWSALLHQRRANKLPHLRSSAQSAAFWSVARTATNEEISQGGGAQIAPLLLARVFLGRGFG